MTHSGSEFEGFTQPLGAIGVGAGRQVLPAPVIAESYNKIIRSYEDSSFYWSSLQASPIGYNEDTGAIPVSFEEPTSYILEITPDLGWSNKESLFESNSTNDNLGNALLKRFTNLTIGIDLTSETIANDPAKQKITYVMPRVDLVKILNPDYENYLWRVFSVRADGIESFPSVIQKFKAQVIIKKLDWAIDPIATPINGLTITFGGPKSPTVTTIEVNGTTGNTVAISPTRWSAETLVTETGQDFLFRAIDNANNTSEYKIVNLPVSTDTLTHQPVWNTFDEFGLLVDLDRIPTEDNTNYKRRILDCYEHRSGPRYKNLINGVTRELDLAFDDLGLTLVPNVDPDTKNDIEGLHFSIGARYAKVEADVFKQVRELHKFDTWDWGINFSKDIIEDSLTVESPIGTEIKPENTWELIDGKLYFKDSSWENRPIYTTYRYFEKHDVSTGTIADLISWVDNLSYNSNNLFESVTTGETIDTGTPTRYLALLPRSEVRRNEYLTFGNDVQTGLPVRWTNGSIQSINDHEFYESQLNSSNNHFGTDMERWAKYLQSFIHTQWGFLISDRNVWSDGTQTARHQTVLPTNYDPSLAIWASSNPQVPAKYRHTEAYSYNYLVPNDGSDMVYKGIPSSFMKCGIGDSTDLLVKIVSENARQLTQADSEVISTVRQSVRDTIDTEGQPIIDSGDGSLPACGMLTV